MQMFGVSWDDSKKPTVTVTLIACALAAALAFGPLAVGRAHAAGHAGSAGSTSVIVRKAPGSGSSAERAVRAAGGTVVRRLGIIHGFAAQLPRSAVDDIASSRGVLAVTPDAQVEMQHYVDGYDPSIEYGSMPRMAYLVGAHEMYANGITGEGVDVALIDTGVVPVEGLSGPNKIVNGPDLSFESQDPALRYLDTYGHGTHMAGIIAGRDSGLTNSELAAGQHDEFGGIAPGARIVNVKVGDAEGATDVSQVVAAIDWVVKHRGSNGLNIRVLNLSFGTDSVQSYVLDPLSYAAEIAWKKGIVVVVAAGNRGFGTKALNNPALNPRLLSVGSMDYQGSFGYGDDQVSDFSSVGSAARRVDLVAPGRSIISLRTPGSLSDVDYPDARIGTRFFKGSGTSQSAALASGAAALLLQQRPSMTPNQVKKLLLSTARQLPNAGYAQGEGLIDVARARRTATPSLWEATQLHTSATGLGTLEGARGSHHLVSGGIELSGEQDIFGNGWNAASWATAALNEMSWVGGLFNGFAWTGDSFDGTSWGSVTWTKNSWSGESWTKNSWSKNSWSGSSWTGDGWVKNSWSAGTWAKNSWSSSDWEKNSWSSAGWR